MGRSDASSSRANIERFGELDETRPKRVGTPQKNGDLDANAGRLPLLGGGGQQIFSLKKLTRH